MSGKKLTKQEKAQKLAREREEVIRAEKQKRADEEDSQIRFKIKEKQARKDLEERERNAPLLAKKAEEERKKKERLERRAEKEAELDRLAKEDEERDIAMKKRRKEGIKRDKRIAEEERIAELDFNTAREQTRRDENIVKAQIAAEKASARIAEDNNRLADEERATASREMKRLARKMREEKTDFEEQRRAREKKMDNDRKAANNRRLSKAVQLGRITLPTQFTVPADFSRTPSDKSLTPSLLSEMEEFQKRNMSSSSSSSSSIPPLETFDQDRESRRLLEIQRLGREQEEDNENPFKDDEDNSNPINRAFNDYNPLDRFNPLNPFNQYNAVDPFEGNNSMTQAGMDRSKSLEFFDVNSDSFHKDNLGPEAQMSQAAYDREEYKGVDTNRIRNLDPNIMEMRRQDDAQSVFAKTITNVQEAGVLAGSDLLNKNSFRDPAKQDDGGERYSDSGFTRGQTARSEKPDIDLENLADAYSEGIDGMNDAGLSSRGAYNIPNVDPSEQIRGLLEQSEQKGGSWYASDENLPQNYSTANRMSRMNFIRRTKDMEIDKFAERSGRDRFLRSQGASIASINELRNKTIDWKQPTRSFKSNQVDLVRTGVRTGRLIDSEFEP